MDFLRVVKNPLLVDLILIPSKDVFNYFRGVHKATMCNIYYIIYTYSYNMYNLKFNYQTQMIKIRIKCN